MVESPGKQQHHQVCECPRAAVKYHKQGGLKRQKCIPSQFWMLSLRSRVISVGSFWGRTCSLPLPASGVCLQSLVSPTGRHVTSIRGALPRASGFIFSASCEDTSHWIRVCSSPVGPRLNLMTSASTLFPIESHSQVLGFKMLTIQFSPRAPGSCEC